MRAGQADTWRDGSRRATPHRPRDPAAARPGLRAPRPPRSERSGQVLCHATSRSGLFRQVGGLGGRARQGSRYVSSSHAEAGPAKTPICDVKQGTGSGLGVHGHRGIDVDDHEHHERHGEELGHLPAGTRGGHEAHGTDLRISGPAEPHANVCSRPAQQSPIESLQRREGSYTIPPQGRESP